MEILTLPDEYSRYITKCISILTQLKSMSDGHLRSIKAVQHRVELHKTDRQPIHSATYCTGPKATEFEKHEINWILAVDNIEPTQMEWASPIVFVTKKVVSLCCVWTTAIWTQWRFRIHTWYHPWRNISICFEMQRYFRHCTLVAGIGKSEPPKNIGIKPPLHPITVISARLVCRSDWTKGQGRFHKRWKSYWRKSRGSLPLCI